VPAGGPWPSGDRVDDECGQAGLLAQFGAEPVIIHALDPDSVAEVVAKAEPNPSADAEDGVAALRHLEEGVTP
jgi:hypothetical protein